MNAIRKYRIKKFWTQTDLAKKCGTDKTTISRLETGKRKPDIIMLKKLADSLDCPIDELLESLTE